MPLYAYRAARPDGTIVRAREPAPDENALRQDLERQGYLVLTIRPDRRHPVSMLEWLGRGGGPRALLPVTQSLLALVRAGVPISQALGLLAGQAFTHRMQSALEDVRRAVIAGSSLSDALGRHPALFPSLFRAFVRTGEESGRLVESLRRYQTHLKRQMALRRKVTAALAYPALLVVLFTGVIAFLLGYVMPRFVDLYADMETALPLPTRMLLEGLDWLGRWGWLLLGGVAAGVLGFVRWFRTEAGRRRAHGWLLGLPLLGGVMRPYATAQLGWTLSTLLAGGMHLVRALEITAEGLGNRAMAVGIHRAATQVREGGSLADAFREQGMLRDLELQMVRVGEATGALEGMLQESAELAEDEVDARLTTAMALLEPLLMLAMGLVVGALIVILYLPIIYLAETVR